MTAPSIEEAVTSIVFPADESQSVRCVLAKLRFHRASESQLNRFAASMTPSELRALAWIGAVPAINSTSRFLMDRFSAEEIASIRDALDDPVQARFVDTMYELSMAQLAPVLVRAQASVANLAARAASRAREAAADAEVLRGLSDELATVVRYTVPGALEA